MKGLQITKVIVALMIIAVIGPAASKSIHGNSLDASLDNEIDQDYQIVAISPLFVKRQRRDVSDGKAYISLNVLGEELNLQLDPVNGILTDQYTPIYTIDNRDVGGYSLTLHEGFLETHFQNLYENREEDTTLSITERDNGAVALVGIIGSKNVSIRPLDSENLLKAEDFKSNVVPKCENCLLHVIEKIPKTPELKTVSYSQKSNPSIPDTFFIETMVLVDYDLFKRFEFDLLSTVDYLLAFWNRVDMKLRYLKNPNYKINIAGIILPEHGDWPFMAKWQYGASSWLLRAETTSSFSVWASGLEQEVPNYDVIVLMESTNPCTRDQSGNCHLDAKSWTFDRSICTEKMMLNNIDNLGAANIIILLDDAEFTGVDHAVRQLENRLSANDTNNQNAENIVVATDNTEINDEGVLRTIENINESINSDKQECLYNKPISFLVSPILITKERQSIEDQCNMQWPSSYGERENLQFRLHSCGKATCWIEGGPEIFIYPRQGTPCGENQICVSDNCVNDPHAAQP